MSTTATSENLPLLGKVAATLIWDNARWVHRRKEVVSIHDDTWLRRQISIDYSLPDIPPVRGNDKDDNAVYAVPLTLMRKSPPAFLNFDLIDETGSAVALRTREQNAAVSLAALDWAAADALIRAGYLARGNSLPSYLHSLLTQVAYAPPPRAALAVRRIAKPAEGDSVGSVLAADDRLMWLVIALAERSIVMVEVPATKDGRRRKLKLCYDERNLNRSDEVTHAPLARGGLTPYTLLIEAPYLPSGTYHFELKAPAGLEIVDTRMREYLFLDALLPVHERKAIARPEASFAEAKTAAVVRRGTRTHLYCPEGDISDRGWVEVDLRVQREGFVASAALAATTVATLLVFLGAALNPVIKHPGVVPPLLLLIPGLVATLVGRAGDHQLTIRMLSTIRRAVLASAACAYLAVIGLALSRTGATHDPTTLLWVLWWTLAVIAVVLAGLLLTARRLPRREATQTKFDPRAEKLFGPLVRLLGSRVG